LKLSVMRKIARFQVLRGLALISNEKTSFCILKHVLNFLWMVNTTETCSAN
jgi:hypothetical protein